MAITRPYKVSLTSRANRELRKLDRQILARISDAIDALATDPRPAGCLKVKAREGLWRIRSAAELLFSLEADENGRLTPKDFNNPDERRMADFALQQALLFLLEVLKLEIEHYGWRDSAPIFQKSFNAYETCLRSYATK